MIATFCLRLSLGMLTSLVLLSSKQMHPRFFRTQLLTVLGLCVVAALLGWTTATEAKLTARLGDGMNWSQELPEFYYRRLALVVAPVLAFVGSLIWMLERPRGGWVVITLTALAILAALFLEDHILTPKNVPAEFLIQQGTFHYSALRIPDDLTSAALLGFGMTAMLVGHSYLIAPGLTIKPLMRQLAALGVALILRVAVAGVALWFWTADHNLTNLNDETVLWLPVRWLIGLVGPLVFGWLAYQTARIRSTQSATGILYVVVILTFLGELTSLLLLRNTGLPL
ncbi:MAG: hypothetical protein ACJ8F7_18555 [Gemmataceae bacterium]